MVGQFPNLNVSGTSDASKVSPKTYSRPSKPTNPTPLGTISRKRRGEQISTPATSKLNDAQSTKRRKTTSPTDNNQSASTTPSSSDTQRRGNKRGWSGYVEAKPNELEEIKDRADNLWSVAGELSGLRSLRTKRRKLNPGGGWREVVDEMRGREVPSASPPPTASSAAAESGFSPAPSQATRATTPSTNTRKGAALSATLPQSTRQSLSPPAPDSVDIRRETPKRSDKPINGLSVTSKQLTTPRISSPLASEAPVEAVPTVEAAAVEKAQQLLTPEGADQSGHEADTETGNTVLAQATLEQIDSRIEELAERYFPDGEEDDEESDSETVEKEVLPSILRASVPLSDISTYTDDESESEGELVRQFEGDETHYCVREAPAKGRDKVKRVSTTMHALFALQNKNQKESRGAGKGKAVARGKTNAGVKKGRGRKGWAGKGKGRA